MNRTILKRHSWVLLAFPLQMVMAAEDLPKPFSFARYQGMSDKSPFAVATAVAAPVETPNFAKDLYIANCAHSPEAELVTIASTTDRNFRKYLTTSMAVDGYTISNIEWSDKVGATKVTISKDGQSATIGFNEALLRQPTAGGQPPPPPPGQNPAAAPPGAPPPVKQAEGAVKGGGTVADPTGAASQAAAAGAATGSAAQQGATKAMPVPALPNQAPRTRGVIPRNPTAPAMKPNQPQPQN